MRAPVTVGVGLVWLASSSALAWGGVEPVATFAFLFSWAGLIFTFDQLIRWTEQRSLIARLGATAFATLVGWSAAWWFAFELANLRLANWHYVLVTDNDTLRLVGTILAFGTVLPGVFWIDHWLRSRDVLRVVEGARLRLTPLRLVGLQILGVVSLVLSLTDPTHFFPLIWGASALWLAPINHRRGIDGWLAQWERGQWGPTLRMLLAGLIAGGFWEFFNFHARARWIYTVPFFDELKLFEMPLLGFIGFPAFALECACFYRWLVWRRLAPTFGDFTQQGPARSATFRTIAVAAALVVSAGGYLAVDRVILTSQTPRVADVAALNPAQRTALRESETTHLTELVGWRSDVRWTELGKRLSPDDLKALRHTVVLNVHQGIGTTFGNQLNNIGITRLADLRQTNAQQLWQQLQANANGARYPSQAQIKVWLHRLPEP